MFIRFSTVTPGREFPDEARNPRGFAIKLYTGEGNYDIVGLNFVGIGILDGVSTTDQFSLSSSAETPFRGQMSFDHNTATPKTFCSTTMASSTCLLALLRVTMPVSCSSVITEPRKAGDLTMDMAAILLSG